MPPQSRLPSAVILLLTFVVLGRGCQSGSGSEGELIACKSDGSCLQRGHVCAFDGFCRPQYAGPHAPELVAHDAYEPETGNIASARASAGGQCEKKCAARQADCTAGCGVAMKCREHCGRSTDLCYARCQRVDDAREAARQRRDAKNCLGKDGRPRKCSPAEEQQLRTAMKQLSMMFCLDGSGEQVPCPEQLQQLERARRFLPKDCDETGCEGDEPGQASTAWAR